MTNGTHQKMLPTPDEKDFILISCVLCVNDECRLGMHPIQRQYQLNSSINKFSLHRETKKSVTIVIGGVSSPPSIILPPSPPPPPPPTFV